MSYAHRAGGHATGRAGVGSGSTGKVGGSTLVQQLEAPGKVPSSKVGGSSLTQQPGGGAGAAEASAQPASAPATSEPQRVERAFRVTTTAGASPGEATIVATGGSEMESTTPPPIGTGSGSGSPAPQFFECKPTSAEIKNVSKFTTGKLYGHAFDFVVGLTYSTLASGAPASKDATLEWWEKTDRPPAWQATVAKDAWNDMFALFPTSPTFDGWTKNRTKPNPGSETASIHDPPGASVDMPARTLEFDLKVKGGGVTKGATAKQVLEPDGKGGIKTQTFTVGK
jgi:hypothetical protein